MLSERGSGSVDHGVTVQRAILSTEPERPVFDGDLAGLFVRTCP